MLRLPSCTSESRLRAPSTRLAPPRLERALGDLRVGEEEVDGGQRLYELPEVKFESLATILEYLSARFYRFSLCVSRCRSSGSSANSARSPRNTAVPLVPVLRQYSRRYRCWYAFRSTVIRIGFAGLPS